MPFSSKVWFLKAEFSGQSTLSKYEALQQKIGEDASMLLLSTLDDIAWLLNLRGNDVEYNPLFFSYAIFHKRNNFKVDLFIDSRKVSEPEIQDYLKAIKVEIHPY